MRFRFGDCTLDSETRELLRGGKPLHLEPKAFRLLELLIAASPKALSKSLAQEELWPKTFVSERSLARLVALLRVAIRDRATKPRFIRTVHGYGYAFCGDVTSGDRPATVFGSNFHCRVAWGDREVALLEGENVLGRDPNATVYIDLNSVSRRHARIVVSGDSATLEDLGSRNGTHLKGQKLVAPALLANGDTIKIGAASLKFRSFRRTGTTQPELE